MGRATEGEGWSESIIIVVVGIRWLIMVVVSDYSVGCLLLKLLSFRGGFGSVGNEGGIGFIFFK